MVGHRKSIPILVFAVILSFILTSRLSACDVTEVHLWIGTDQAAAVSHNTTTVYKPKGNTTFGYHVHWLANPPDTDSFEVKIYDGGNVIGTASPNPTGTLRECSGTTTESNLSTGNHSIKATVKRVNTSTTHDSVEIRTLVVVEVKMKLSKEGSTTINAATSTLLN